MRDSLAAWLRRLANRISTPRTAAATSAQFAFNAASYDDAHRYLQRREALKYSARP